MAGTETKRIIELTEASTVQSGDFIAVDSNARGTKKVPTSALATSAALTAETNARAGADEQMSERMDGIEEQTALIQNPTKTLSGALCSFTDGADMPMVACTASIAPKQSGTGTPSPDNVRPISGWSEVNSIVSDEQKYDRSSVEIGKNWFGGSDAKRAILSFVVEPSTRYKVITKGGNFSQVLFIRFENYTRITDSNISPSFDEYVTTESNCNRVVIQFAKVAKTSKLYTVPLGRTVYGGTLDVVTGVLTVTHGIRALDGTEQYADYWNLSTTNRIGVYIPNSRNTEYTNFWCSHYGTYAFTALANNGIAKAQSTNLAYVIKDSANCLSVNGYKAYVAQQYANGTPITLCYELATPQTYTLTGQEIETLLGSNNVWADSGDVEITYRRDISIVINNLESALNG